MTATPTPPPVEQLTSIIPGPGWLVGVIVLVLGVIWGINQGALGILWADTLRPHVPWLGEEEDESAQQRQGETIEASGSSVDVSGTTSLEQDSSHGSQSAESNVSVEGADRVGTETRQAQGDSASSDEDSELLPDGGTVSKTPPEHTAGLFDRIRGESSDGGNHQEQSAEANVDARTIVNTGNPQNLPSGTQGSVVSGSGDQLLQFNYHPHGVDGSNIDGRASTEGQFPIYGTDGEAQIDASMPASISEHWIEVTSPSRACDVVLRDGKKVDIDNDSEPPRFRPEPGASSIAVGILVYAEVEELGYQLIVQPGPESEIDPPGGCYFALEIVRRE